MIMLNHSYFIWNDPWDKKSLRYYRDIHSLSQKWVPLLGSLIQGFRIPAWGTLTSSLSKSYILIWFASRRSLRGVHSILFKFCEVPLQLFLFQHAKDFFSLYVRETLMTLIFREADISYILRKKLFLFFMIPNLHSLMFREADLFCVSWGGFPCNSLSRYYILLLLKCYPSSCITFLTKYVIIWVLWWCRERKCSLDIIRLTKEKIMKITMKMIKVNYENYTWRNKSR